MAAAESTTKTFYDEDTQIKIRHIFEKCIDPNQILHVFGKYDERILSKRHKEEVQAETDRKGKTGGADLLLDLLPHYENWFRCLIKVLKDREVGQSHVAEMMLEEVGLDESDMDETHSEVHNESSQKVADDMIHLILKTGTDKSLMAFVMLLRAKYGDFKYVKELIEKGANINKPDDDGKTVLMHVVGKGDSKDAIWLLEKAADISITDNDTCTALSYAASYGRDDCVEVLLNAGSHEQINLPDNHGQTPLMLAAKCKKDKVLCLQKLLDKEADVNMRDSNGHTALAHAAGCGNVRCVETLLEVGNHENVNLQNMNGQTPLMLAARSTQDSTQCLQKLLSASADVAIKDSNGYTALFHAAESGNVAHIQALLYPSCYMHINASNNSGQTPLMLAARTAGDKVQCLEVLLSKGADVNKEDSDGKNALHHAKDAGNTKCVKLLQNVVACRQVNSPNISGQTAVSVGC